MELLLQRLAHAPPDAALVFNCQVRTWTLDFEDTAVLGASGTRLVSRW